MTFKEQLQNFSIARVLFAVLFLLLVINNIKILPEDVPVVHAPFLEPLAKATPFVILTKEYPISEYALAHERCHIAQYNRYGSVWTVIISTYYHYKYDYWDNPLEVQAYNFTDFCEKYK